MPMSDKLTAAWFKPGYLETIRQSACVQFWLPDYSRAKTDLDWSIDAKLEGRIFSVANRKLPVRHRPSFCRSSTTEPMTGFG